MRNLLCSIYGFLAMMIATCNLFPYIKMYSHPSLLQCLQGITGYICGSEGFDSSGLSSSAAVS